MSARLTADQRRLLDRLLEEEAGQAGRPERAGQPGRAALVPGAADRTRSELSFAQQRIWFFDRVRPGSSLYTISGAAQLRGALDTRVLRRALDEVLRRHESLRTTFPGEHEPWARVEEAGPVDLRETDLSGLPEERRSAAVREHLAAEAARPFDLARDRMLRCALLRLAPDEHLLQLSMHHIAADGWSLGVLIGELGTLYEAFQQGRPSPLPDLGVQYADFARWQRQLTREPRHTELLEKWTDRLAGAAPLDLVTDRPRRTEESYAGGWADLELPPELVARIKRFADRERATPFMVLSAAFAALLARWAGRAEDVLLGCAVAGRDRTEIEPLIGFFVNTLPLRLDLSGNPSLRTLVGRARRPAPISTPGRRYRSSGSCRPCGPSGTRAHACRWYGTCWSCTTLPAPACTCRASRWPSCRCRPGPPSSSWRSSWRPPRTAASPAGSSTRGNCSTSPPSPGSPTDCGCSWPTAWTGRTPRSGT